MFAFPRALCLAAFASTYFLYCCNTALAKEQQQAGGRNDGKVDVWAYSIFPQSNPQERYPYFSSGLCVFPSAEHKSLTLGERLAGYRYTRPAVTIVRQENVERGAECEEFLTPAKLRHTEALVRAGYWYEWTVDGLPVWAPLGAVSDNGVAYVYTHRAFNISHDPAGRVVAATLDVSDLRALTDYAAVPDGQLPLLMTYSVGWTASATDYDYRFDRYLEPTRFGGPTRFFAVFFACTMTIFVSSISCVSYAGPVSSTPDRTSSQGEKSTAMFCAAIGLGFQVAFAAAAVACAGLFGAKFIAPGEFAADAALFYALGGMLGGYAGTRAHCSAAGGQHWLRVPLLYMCVGAPLAACGAWLFLGFVAAAGYGSIFADVSFGAVASVLGIHVFAVVPLTFLGALVAHKRYLRSKAPTLSGAATLNYRRSSSNGVVAAAAVARNKPWKSRVMVGTAWCFEYLCVALELHYVSYGVWGYGVFSGYGYTFFSLVALYCCAGRMGIITTVFAWNTGDASWEWNAFVSGAGVAVPAFLHFAVFYTTRTAMTGFLQFLAFFSTAGLISAVLALSCGAVSFATVAKYMNDASAPRKKE